MRILIEYEYGDSILTSDLTDMELTIFARAFDKAFIVKKEGWGADSKLVVLDKELPAVRIVCTTAKLLPELSLRESCKKVLAEEAAKAPNEIPF